MVRSGSCAIPQENECRVVLYTPPTKLCEGQNLGLGFVLVRKLAFELLCLR